MFGSISGASDERDAGVGPLRRLGPRFAVVLVAVAVVALEIAAKDFWSAPLLLESATRLAVWAGLMWMVTDVAKREPLRATSRVFSYCALILVSAVASVLGQIMNAVTGLWLTKAADLLASVEWSGALAVVLSVLGFATKRQRSLWRVWLIACLFQLPPLMRAAYDPRFIAATWRASVETPARDWPARYRAGYMVESLLDAHLLDGKTEAEVERLLGAPSFRSGDQLNYRYTNSWSCSDRLGVSVKDGRVTAAYAWPCD